MTILEATSDLDIDQLLQHTAELEEDKMKHCDLFHRVIDSLCLNMDRNDEAVRFVYVLRNYGYNINQTDNNGCTPLLKYLLNCETINNAFMEAMLRCNADVFYKNEDDVCAFAEARKPHISRTTKEIFARYMPGIWKAVASDDVHRVRFLVNQWCRVDVEKDGKSLLQLALEKGTENVIGIVSGIRPSMDMAHGVLAGDVKFVKSVMNRGGTININLKNLGDGGLTPIYYAALQNNEEMIKLLQHYGARVHCSVVADDETEMSLYFALMRHFPQVSTATLKLLLPVSPVHIEMLHYQGVNVLFHCVDCNVSTELLSAIMDVSSAYLVTAKQKDGLTPKEYAVRQGCDDLASVIDQYVYVWWTDPKHSNNRKILMLHSYGGIPKALMPTTDSGFEDSDGSLEPVEQYKAQIQIFHQAVEEGDLEKAESFLYFNDSDQFEASLANSRQQGDCQPPLHKAVLRRDENIVRLLAENIVYKQHYRLDYVRDRFYRTALHYAYALLDDGKEIINILEDHGASEFVMDKDGRSPMMFKDRRDQPEMSDLLQYHLTQDFNAEEPDPWSTPLQIPIIGYILNCAQSRSHFISNNLAQQLHILPAPHDHNAKALILNKQQKGKHKFLKSKSIDNINLRSTLSAKFRNSHSKGKQKRPNTISEFGDLSREENFRRRSANDVHLVRPVSFFGKFRKSKEYIVIQDKGDEDDKICEDPKESEERDLDELEQRLRRHSLNSSCVLL